MYSASDSSWPSRRSRSVRRRRRLLVASAALLAAASLLGKALNLGAETDAGFASDGRRIQDFLGARGWVPSGPAEEVPGGAVLPFRVPGCSGDVRVGLLPATGEIAGLFAAVAGPGTRVFYIHRGRVFDHPPRLAYFQAKLARLASALAFSLQPDRPVVAIGQPESCRLESTLPWSEL
jgi:hypothetical protein